MTPPPPVPPAPPASPLVLLLVGAFLLVPGVGITALGAMEIGPEVELRTAGTRTTAKVTGSRTMTRRRTGTSYEVQYRFKVKGKTYTHEDATGRTNLWNWVEEDEWHKANETGKLPILYLARDPHHNRPVDMPWAMGDKIAGLGLGLSLVFFGGVFGVWGIRSWWRGRAVA